MKNKIFIYTVLLLTLVLQTSCHDNFLEEEPFDFLASENFYTNDADAKAAVTAAYSAFQGADMYGNLFNGIADLPSEQITNRLQRTDQFGIYDQFIWLPESPTTNVWQVHYAAINKCNAVIINVPNVEGDISPQNKARYVAEAQFLRALAYFNLIRFFGNVPLVTKEKSSLADSYPTNQGTANAVWQLIIDDLKAAEAVLPPSYPNSDKGRATKGAAMGILAKVYLQRSGLGVADEWSLAASTAKEVVDAGTYGLNIAYGDNFSLDTEWSKETIFAINFTPGLGDQGQSLTTNTAFFGTIPFGGYGTFLGEANFLDTWDTADKRYPITWSLEYTDADGVVQTYPDGELFEGFAQIGKYITQDGLSNNDYGLDVPVMRYSDLLLVHSEAVNEATGPSEEAVFGLNEVRNRAGLVEYDYTTMTKETLREAIIQERVWEFVMEGQALFDYQRKGILEERNERSSLADIIVVEPFHYLFPIPQREMNLNTNLVQNPGY